MAHTLNDRQGRVTLGILAGAWLIMMVPTVAVAQEADSRWAPWIGCWRVVVGEAASAPVVCVVPLAGESAIEILTMLDDQVLSRESIFADGRQHEVSRGECEGWEAAEFSDDSRRVYVRSELTCGVSAPRSLTGVISMVSPSEWLDVRTVVEDGQSAPWAARYQLASRADFRAVGQDDLAGTQGAATRMARMAASIPIAPDDVIEATGKVSAETVQLWVVERGEGFALDAVALIEMADSGVPPSVIDVVVAVSYPGKFVLNEGAPSAGGPAVAGAVRGASRLGYDRSLSPFDDPFYDPYGRYGYGSLYGSRLGDGFGYMGRYGYGYSRYGSRYGYGGGRRYGGDGYGLGYGGGYGYGYGGYGGPIIVVGRRGSSSGPAAGWVAPRGGYTSARNSDGSTGRTARPRSSGSSGSPAPAARVARPRSSGGVQRSAAPRRGSSSPSRGSAGSRVARPRENPGN
jgi:hypothetical protein